MMLPFQKAQDETTKTAIFYDAVKGFPVGEMFTFEKLKILTGFNVQRDDRALVYQANKQLLRNDRKMLQSVRKVGYKMATPLEQMAHAGKRRLRGSRQFRRGVMEAANVDVSNMTDEQRLSQMHLVNHLSTLLSASRKRSLEGLQQTKRAKASLEKAEAKQAEAVNEVTLIQQQLNALMKRLGG